jgi:hypothetical protein
MKTKIILLIAMVALLFSFASVSRETSNKPGHALKKASSAEVKVGQGLAMEDRDQFN